MSTLGRLGIWETRLRLFLLVPKSEPCAGLQGLARVVSEQWTTATCQALGPHLGTRTMAGVSTWLYPAGQLSLQERSFQQEAGGGSLGEWWGWGPHFPRQVGFGPVLRRGEGIGPRSKTHIS